MPELCKDYHLTGYCLRGRECPDRHGNDLIELDVAQYQGLVEAMHKAIASSRQKQNDLKRKQTDLLRNLVSQQRALIEKIELCSDEAEKVRLKAVLNEMSQKTKDWIEAQSSQHQSSQTQVAGTGANSRVDSPSEAGHQSPSRPLDSNES